jgi:hypothetical protein
LTSPARVPGKLGKLPPKNAPALHLGAYLTGLVPEHPADANNFAVLDGGWQMLGNDRWGDCVGVTWANIRRLMTNLAGAEHYPSLGDVIAVYKTQNPEFPSQDDGMDIQTLLEYLTKNGGPDGVKPVCFAKVDPRSTDEVKAAIAIFGYVWTGITVTAANMNQFAAGRPWDYNPESPNDGGHSIITGGYDGDGTGGDERFVTWGQETAFTDAFWSHQVDEAWVVIWPEHLGSRAFLAGVDQVALAADYTSLTGRPFPVQPTPEPIPAPPQPAPSPVPVPTDVDRQLAYIARSWLSRTLHSHAQTVALRGALTDWMDVHYPSNGDGGRHRNLDHGWHG